MTSELWILIAILVMASICAVLIGVTLFLAIRAVNDMKKSEELTKSLAITLVEHEEEEGRNWIAITESLAKSFAYIIRWQKLTAKMTAKDAKLFARHDRSVIDLLDSARDISKELRELSADIRAHVNLDETPPELPLSPSGRKLSHHE